MEGAANSPSPTGIRTFAHLRRKPGLPAVGRRTARESRRPLVRRPRDWKLRTSHEHRQHDGRCGRHGRQCRRPSPAASAAQRGRVAAAVDAKESVARGIGARGRSAGSKRPQQDGERTGCSPHPSPLLLGEGQGVRALRPAHAGTAPSSASAFTLTLSRRERGRAAAACLANSARSEGSSRSLRGRSEPRAASNAFRSSFSFSFR